MNYDELEAKVLDSIETSSPKFEQKEFAMASGIIPPKSVIEMGIGGGIAGIVSNQVGRISMMPTQLTSITGLVPAAVGTIVKMVTKKTGMVDNLSTGLIIGGIAEFVSTFARNQGFGTTEVAQQREKQAENTQIVPQGLNAIW
tara:strand:+ start:258 stop:686 length:429 start_codon:yes stop_codon:yes gene_type:complete